MGELISAVRRRRTIGEEGAVRGGVGEVRDGDGPDNK